MPSPSSFFLALTGNGAKWRRLLVALLAVVDAGEAHGREEVVECNAEVMQQQGHDDGAECGRGRESDLGFVIAYILVATFHR